MCSDGPVGRVVFWRAGNVLRILVELVLRDLGLQVLQLGPPGSGARCLTLQLLLLGLVARRRQRVGVFADLQEALVPLLILPVCEDLGAGRGQGSSESSGHDGSLCYHHVCLFGPYCTLNNAWR